MPAWWTRSSSPKEAKKKKKDADSSRATCKAESKSSNPPGGAPAGVSLFGGINSPRPGELSSPSGTGSGFTSESEQPASRTHRLPPPSALSPVDQISLISSVSSDSSSGSCSDPGYLFPRYVDGVDVPRQARNSFSIYDHQIQQQFTESKQLLSSSPGSEFVRPPNNGFTHSVYGSPQFNKLGLSSSPKVESDLSFATAHNSSYSPPRVSTDTKISLAHRRNSANHSLAPSPRARSPGPGLRVNGACTPPLPSRSESPRSRQDDSRFQCHPLPLPPSFPCSPTSPPPTCSTSTSTSSTPHSSTRTGFSKSSCTNSELCLKSRWKKGKLLGRGTFGHVYVGFNSESGQMCAIKEVNVIPDDPSSKECLKQLNQEISLLSQLSHPNIVQYYGSDMDDSTLSVYLEYVSGGSIHKLLQEYGQFKEPVIRNYTTQILSGLSYLHKRKTVHRDIKGANILVDPNGVIKLADFGMAKHINCCSTPLSFKGSPYWMAPEVIMNGNGYNWAVDIWSLGCTVLEMVTAKPPWIQYEGVAAIFKIGNSKEIPPIPDYVSDEGKNFISLCLQRDPSLRPTAAQLLGHPFVRDQAATKAPIIRSVTDPGSTSPYGFQSLTSPNQATTRSTCSTRNSPIRDGDYRPHCSVGCPITLSSSEELLSRRNMSLPVSPSSSPLRQFRPTVAGGLLSPPHVSSATSRSSSYQTQNSVTPRVQVNSIYMDPEVYRMMIAPDGPTARPYR
ncbi:mitogen-activated protein kinase kinase kinase 3-like [Nymphaea colorata]|nr:mitogen-activated protein kinase kinase kinase 3-like [Nymphaea colorata]